MTAPTDAPRSSHLVVRVMGAATACVLLAASCSIGRGRTQPMQLRVLNGTAEVVRDGEITRVRSESGVQVGDQISLDKKGVADLTLAEGRSFELAGAQVRVVRPNRLTLRRGQLLSVIEAPAVVHVGDLEVAASNATFRIDKTVSTRTGVYQGEARLSSAGDNLRVERLRQAIFAGGQLPGKVKPLRLDHDDRWDRRFLQEAIDLDIRLANFGRGLEAQLGSGGGIEFFSRLLPGLDVSFLTPFLGNRRSDVLIGLTISQEASSGNGSAVAKTFENAFGLWSDGGSWGLIAYELNVKQPTLFQRLLDTLNRTGIVVGGRGSALAAPAQVPGGGAAGPAGPGGSGGSTGGGGSSGSPPGGGGGGGSPGEPSPSPSPDPVQGTVDEVLDLVPLPSPTSILPNSDPLPSLPVDTSPLL